MVCRNSWLEAWRLKGFFLLPGILKDARNAIFLWQRSTNTGQDLFLLHMENKYACSSQVKSRPCSVSPWIFINILTNVRQVLIPVKYFTYFQRSLTEQWKHKQNPIDLTETITFSHFEKVKNHNFFLNIWLRLTEILTIFIIVVRKYGFSEIFQYFIYFLNIAKAIIHYLLNMYISYITKRESPWIFLGKSNLFMRYSSSAWCSDH